jgi:alkylation response protein AidB-like acyl-CoA dehydrogenase
MSFSYEQQIESIAALAASQTAETDRGGFPAKTLAAFAEAGFYGLVSSPEVGGHGLGMAAATYVVERLARECGSTAMIVCMHYAATAVIEAHGPLATRQAIAAGKHLSTLAFSEFGSRSHFWAPVGGPTAARSG